ncbi:hypothetical protein DXV76_07265 [Rhodobacteraceae bacterium CCMM004]|nr:hypothetical protein DXV76_07265 [Rhodobacteraceae bacterium CCMM004]
MPTSQFVQRGVTFGAYARDIVACPISACRKVPVSTQVDWTPDVGVYSADTNTALRRSPFEICMGDRGDAPADIPLCIGERATAARKMGLRRRGQSERLRIGAGTS